MNTGRRVRRAAHGRGVPRLGPTWATRGGGLVRRYHPVASVARGRYVAVLMGGMRW